MNKQRTLTTEIRENGFFESLPIDDHEYGLIVFGLRCMKSKLAHDGRRAKHRGFVPAPGALDVTELKTRALIGLMDRLGIEQKGTRK